MPLLTISRDDAVYPYDVPYPPGTTQASNKKAGEAEMVSSQHLAAATPNLSKVFVGLNHLFNDLGYLLFWQVFFFGD